MPLLAILLSLEAKCQNWLIQHCGGSVDSGLSKLKYVFWINDHFACLPHYSASTHIQVTWRIGLPWVYFVSPFADKRIIMAALFRFSEV